MSDGWRGERLTGKRYLAKGVCMTTVEVKSAPADEERMGHDVGDVALHEMYLRRVCKAVGYTLLVVQVPAKCKTLLKQ